MWKTIYDKLVSEISQSCIDWDRVELLIKELGTKINERYDDEDSLLSFLYLCVRSGKAALELTERFLSNGYDVSANAGFNGSACLHRLCRSFYDHYILPVAQRLLEAGADSSLNIYGDKEEEGVLDSIGSKSGYWVFGYFDSANIFEAYYKMVQRKEEGKPYKGIRAFRDSVGQKIEKVGRIKTSEEDASPYYFREALIFLTKEGGLVVDEFLSFILNPYFDEGDALIEDLSEAYSDIIGSRIRSLRFESQSFARLGFSNKKSLLFMKPRESEDIKPRLCAIQSVENHFVLKPGMHIGKFLFNEIRSSSSHGAVYYLKEAFFLIDEKFFHLYQREKASGSNSLRIEQYPVHWGDQLKRTIEDTEAMIREVKYVGRALKWFEAETAEGFIYFCAGDSEELLFYKSGNRQKVPQEADKGHCKDQLKKINFI